MCDSQPIKNSEVFVLGAPPAPFIPPPSPPSICSQSPLSLSPSNEDLALLPPPSTHQSTRHESTIATPPPSTPSPVPIPPARLLKAARVLSTTTEALASLTRLYATSSQAQASFLCSLSVIHTSLSLHHGKVIVSGVGKSGIMAQKLVSTLTSVSVPSSYLHPVEALHGDIGKLAPHDVLIFITFSGSTPEILALLPHLREDQDIIVITQHVERDQCRILDDRPRSILLPAPIKEKEEQSYGVNAPTTSTSVALALCDALALSIADALHGKVEEVSQVFDRNHPGGAIGANLASKPANAKSRSIGDVMVPISAIPNVGHAHSATGADVLMATLHSTSGWVRCEQSFISPQRMKECITKEQLEERLNASSDLFCRCDQSCRTPMTVDEVLWQLRQSTSGADLAIVLDSRSTPGAVRLDETVLGVVDLDLLLRSSEET